MTRWPWFERKFNFDYPVEKAPEIVERLRGTPARVDALLEGVPAEIPTKSDGRGWTIQENLGHLADLHELMFVRLEQYLAGSAELAAADLQNRRTHAANHNGRRLDELLAEFRAGRQRFVDRLEACQDADWGRTAVHPRLKQPMRLVDHAYFFAEHDDYHLARMRELVRSLGGA